jgi:2-amino-4-hydroxy-6-hydroxymethyldihydropteridine diphosphokinase
MECDGGVTGGRGAWPQCMPSHDRPADGPPDDSADGMAAAATAQNRPVRSLIGCGANLGCPREQLDRAIDMLRFMPGVNLLDVSRFIETRPIGGPPGQPAYLNAACLVETGFEPEDLLEMLAAIENTLDRRRDQRWGPRSIDLDLLLHGDRVIESERLQLPHPRMTTRRFVLEPAAEIAPELTHPLAGCTIGDLLENISQRHLHVAVVGIPGSGCSEIATAVADVTLARQLHAPAPLPVTGGLCGAAAEATAFWQETLRQYAAPLKRSAWPRDPHGTVTDYWLESVRLAAERCLAPTGRPEFLAAFNRLVAETVPPHVVLFLQVSRVALGERIAFRCQQTRRSDVFGDLGCSGLPAAAEADALLSLQDDLQASLSAGSGPLPKAVIRLDADDIGQAANDAVAAIEAIQ